MNCREFNEQLYDYLDDPLGSELATAAREHLQDCAACRRAVLREKALTQSFRLSLEGVTQNLSLRPEMLRNVLKELDSKPSSTNALIRAWQWVAANLFRPVSAGAAFLGVLVLFISLHARHQPAEDLAAPAALNAGQSLWIVDVPIQTQTHLFRRQNGMVVDTIATSFSVGQARLLVPKTSPKSL